MSRPLLPEENRFGGVRRLVERIDESPQSKNGLLKLIFYDYKTN